jgi:hypothetical protein
MIIDPFGDVIAECRTGNEIQTATLTPGKLTDAGGYRYKKARRPDLSTETGHNRIFQIKSSVVGTG